MKSKLIVLLGIIVIVLVVLLNSTHKNIESNSNIEVTFDPQTRNYSATIHGYGQDQTIYAWYDEKDHWFFLPSYTEGFKLIDNTGVDAPYGIENIHFMYSKNVPTLFIDTTEDIGRLYEDKSNSVPGRIKIIEADGRTAYDGDLEGINGRGNTTWGADKHPYNIHLAKKSVLLGMGASKKWCLMACYKEGTHLNNRLAMDIANAFDMKYTSDSEWVDFYLNGEYLGNYLLMEPISISDSGIPGNNIEKWNEKNNEDIFTAANFVEDTYKGYLLDNGDMTEGTYLVERDSFFFYEAEKAGFSTEDGGTFTIKEPEYASREQVEYIKKYFEHVSDSVKDGSIDLDAFDLESLADRGWVEEITLNQDAFFASMYFYKLQGDDKLYSGPVWDYDRSFGENNSRNTDGKFVNPKSTTFEFAYWYKELVNDERFRPVMRSSLQDAQKELEKIVNEKIDDYSEYIRQSVIMDHIRWKYDLKMYDRPGLYESYDNNIRFLKWFLSERLNYLYDEWEVPHNELSFEGDGTLHKVTVRINDEVVLEKEVEDGKLFTEKLPELPEGYEGWRIEFCNEPYWQCLPVLEDIVIYASEAGE